MRNQGQGHVRQRGQRSWELKFDLGRDPVSGKRISRYVNFQGTKREAQAELNRLLSRRNEGTYIDPTKMTVAEYLAHWLSAPLKRIEFNPVFIPTELGIKPSAGTPTNWKPVATVQAFLPFGALGQRLTELEPQGIEQPDGSYVDRHIALLNRERCFEVGCQQRMSAP